MCVRQSSIATCTMHIGATFVAQGEIKEGIQQFKTALMADVDGNWFQTPNSRLCTLYSTP